MYSASTYDVMKSCPTRVSDKKICDCIGNEVCCVMKLFYEAYVMNDVDCAIKLT